MKAISIHTLFATAIALQYKLAEMRSWRTSYRGDILICASKTDYKDKELKDNYIFGHAIAIATIIDCVKYQKELRPICFLDDEIDDKDLEGQYCFILDNIKAIKPIPIKGQQRIFNVPLEKKDLEILDIDTYEDPDALFQYWYDNHYIKDLEL
ncbi:MAG: RNA-binding protein [Peptoniphilaceae bacterium]|nr:RNA-binding protein [Peptoniphilaceae bacterium]MDY6018631.1 RNA-binding protein [Anaerococcus sp.]